MLTLASTRLAIVSQCLYFVKLELFVFVLSTVNQKPRSCDHKFCHILNTMKQSIFLNASMTMKRDRTLIATKRGYAETRTHSSCFSCFWWLSRVCLRPLSLTAKQKVNAKHCFIKVKFFVFLLIDWFQIKPKRLSLVHHFTELLDPSEGLVSNPNAFF